MGKVAIGAPTGLADQATLDLLHEFDIAPAQAFGFDPATGGAPPAAFGGSYASTD